MRKKIIKRKKRPRKKIKLIWMEKPKKRYKWKIRRMRIKKNLKGKKRESQRLLRIS